MFLKQVSKCIKQFRGMEMSLRVPWLQLSSIRITNAVNTHPLVPKFKYHYLTGLGMLNRKICCYSNVEKLMKPNQSNWRQCHKQYLVGH